MKKVLFVALVGVSLAFASCGGETKTEEATTDTTAVTGTETVEDTAVAPVDTTSTAADSAATTPSDTTTVK